MAEQQHEAFGNAREDPQDSVPNPRVPRSAMWAYVAPFAAFVLAGGIFVWYFSTRPPVGQTTEEVWKATGTTGETSPGGRSPDPVPPNPEKEIEERGVIRDLSKPPAPRLDPALMLTELTQVRDAKPEQLVGRRVDVQDVGVVGVRSGTSFEIQEGGTRVEVIAAEGTPAVRQGQRVNIIGTLEGNGAGGVRIRASRVDVHN